MAASEYESGRADARHEAQFGVSTITEATARARARDAQGRGDMAAYWNGYADEVAERSRA